MPAFDATKVLPIHPDRILATLREAEARTAEEHVALVMLEALPEGGGTAELIVVRRSVAVRPGAPTREYLLRDRELPVGARHVFVVGPGENVYHFWLGANPAAAERN